jgi:folate-binding protein YgfZ
MTAGFGDVTGEYGALRNATGLVAGAHDVVWVEGVDSVEFLDGLLSQSIGAIPVGGAAPALLLAPQGKLRATLWVLRGEGRLALVADSGRGAVVLGDLTRFKLRVDVELTSEGGPILDIWGPGAAELLAGLRLPAPGNGEWAEHESGFVASLPFRSAALPRYVSTGVPAEDLAARGARPAGMLAATAVRIEAGEAVVGADLDDTTIPQEGGVVADAVDFTKGCFLGQELVARIDSRGRVNRHLRGIVVEADVLPPPGAEIVSAGNVVGALSSVAESPSLQAPIALALVRREVRPGDSVELRWEGGRAPARVEELPLDKSL